MLPLACSGIALFPPMVALKLLLPALFGIEESIIDIYTPPSGLLDVVFLVDQSASMAGTIEIFQREIDQVVERLRERVPDTRLVWLRLLIILFLALTTVYQVMCHIRFSKPSQLILQSSGML